MNCSPCRVRTYRIFYKSDKYIWDGPPLRQLLKIVAPHRELNLKAEDCYWMEDEELVLWIWRTSLFHYFFYCLFHCFFCLIPTIKVEAGGMGSGYFEDSLSEKAMEFREAYATHFKNSTIWEHCCNLETLFFFHPKAQRPKTTEV